VRELERTSPLGNKPYAFRGLGESRSVDLSFGKRTQTDLMFQGFVIPSSTLQVDDLHYCNLMLL